MLVTGTRSAQRGVTLFLALIILVALLLSTMALFRTVDSGILQAGNIAAQRNATRQADQGTEAAIVFLAANAAGTALHANIAASGYVANGLGDVPNVGETWAAWWARYSTSHTPVVLAADASTGNTVSYFVQRLCSAPGAPFTVAACSGPPEASGTGSSKGNVLPLEKATSVYYRVTSRVVGPRNTVSFIQTIVSM